MEGDELLWDLDSIPPTVHEIDVEADVIEDDSPLPAGIDEGSIDHIVSLVKKQYKALQEENSKLLQLIDMVKRKIEQCVKKEGGFASAPSASLYPMNLEVKKEAHYRSEVEEEDDDEEEEIILGGF